MCCECGRTPCNPRCPNFDASIYLHEFCKVCGDILLVDDNGPYIDEFYYINGDYVCEDCLEDYCEKHFKGAVA